MKKRAVVLTLLLALNCIWSACGQAAEWEKHIMQETIYVEGLQEEYTLLFLTDMHMVRVDETASGQERENQEERSTQFVSEEGVPSWEQFSEWIAYANEQEVDAVLLGGDIIDTPSRANLEWLGAQLSALNMPYLYVNGNHDWTYPWEYMTEEGANAYLPLLEPFMQGNTAIHSLGLGELKLVGIDNSTNQVNDAVPEEYAKLLAEGSPVVVLAHVPFMTQSVLGRANEVWNSPVVIGAGNYGGIYPNEASEAFVNMTIASDSPVALVLAGHVHFYDIDVIDGERDVTQLVGAAGYEGCATLITISGKK